MIAATMASVALMPDEETRGSATNPESLQGQGPALLA